MRRPQAALAALALGAAALPLLAHDDVPSRPVDCLPDALSQWEAVDAALRYGTGNLPGIVLGPPGESTATTGSTTVASLGIGGRAAWALDDVVIEDGPGPDFSIYENAFFQGSPPAGPEDDYAIFHEPAFVEVSAEGEAWLRFPYDQEALDEAGASSTIDKALHLRLGGLAGVTPTLSGNWTMPEDPAAWDPDGEAGLSGAGGDAFDLAAVGLAEARFVRVVDAAYGNGPAGAAEGFDVDALVVHHGRPRKSAAADADADGLPDRAESLLYGTDPARADSDGDGTDDGRELASCRDPLSGSTQPYWSARPALWLREEESCAELRWTWVAEGALHDLLRGEIGALAGAGGRVDLGPTTCLAAEYFGVSWGCDAEQPLPGAGFFYLVRLSSNAGEPAPWGRASSLDPRDDGGGGCP